MVSLIHFSVTSIPVVKDNLPVQAMSISSRSKTTTELATYLWIFVELSVVIMNKKNGKTGKEEKRKTKPRKDPDSK